MTKSGIVGQVLDGKYNIEKQLGKGGMGTVYLATHIGTGRPVAVKVIVPEYMERAEFVERFRREARAAGRLRHPNVVDVTDFGFADSENNENVAYLVMEYLDGCTLGEVLEEEKQLPLSFSIDILEQVCSAVDEAHNEGIIHRDLKPENIWLEPNQRGGYTVKVLDFGIAKLEESTEVSPKLDDQIQPAGDESVGQSESNTVIEDSGSDTIVDKKTPTLVSEKETVELSEDSKSGHLKDEPVDSEGGTVLLPSGETKSIEPEIGKATRLIDRPVETDESRVGVPPTAELTRAGAVLGTPLYMSPEQCRGEKLSTRSDIYSLAVILYQMLSGSPPFEGDYRAVMDGHKSLDPPPLVANKTPKKLRKIVMEALAKNPADRPETAEAFASKVRGSAEGLGVLLRRAVVIYSERLPKLLQLTILTFLPLIALNIFKGGFGLAVGFGFINDYQIISIGFEVIHFFLSIITSAFLVGMMTWVVAHYLAYPLRPMSLRPAFKEVRMRARSLSLTVGLSTIIAFIGYAFCLLPGVWLSARFMLIAPSIMMEDISGRAAFRRSIELTKRSFRTVFATALLVYVIPATAGLIIGIFIALANTAYVQSLRVSKMNQEIKTMKEKGVKAEPKAEKEKDSGDSVKVEFGSKKIGVFATDELKFNGDSETKEKVKKFGAVSQVVSQALLIPLIVIMASFTSVITALLYFKTRQSGGESMQGLLSKLDDADRPQTRWQQRVRERLIQSGKITPTPSGS